MEPRSYSNLSPKHGWSWENTPAPIQEDVIAETLEADVTIIGGGVSGLAAGARCTQKGMSVIIIDKYERLIARAENVAALDSRVMREKGVSIDKKKFARDWMAISGSRVNEDILWLFINRSGEALQWLLDMSGGAAEAALMTGGYKGPDFGAYPGSHKITRKKGCSAYENSDGGMLVCEILEKEFLKNGGRIFRGVRAEQLEKDKTGRVTAYIAKGRDGRYRRYRGKKAVILATGGIGGDTEMMEAFCPIGLKTGKNLYYPAGLNTGDGHKMAYWAGAAFDDLTWAPAFCNLAYCGYSFFFLHINSRGRRFMNEDTWMQAKAIRCLMQPGGDYAYTIMDGKWLEEFGERFALIGGPGIVPSKLSSFGDVWNPDCGLEAEIEQAVGNGLGAKADTLEALADKIGVPAETLLKTVARYNEMAEKGDDTDFGKRSALLTSIVKPPFYAIKWGPALLDVFGGALTNTRLNVIGPDRKPIPGLYAVGTVSGGMYGVDYPLLMSGSSYGRALTWALAVADGIESDSGACSADLPKGQ